MNYKESIKSFVIEELLDDLDSVDEDEVLLSDDLVDSIGMVRLVAHIEETFDISIPAEHLTIENFRSINTISKYLENLR